MMLVFSQRSLRLDTIILEECVLTDIRTAAAAALGSKEPVYFNTISVYKLLPKAGYRQCLVKGLKKSRQSG